jgi:cyclopropane-fatty-acyl-phospholipid synthase
LQDRVEIRLQDYRDVSGSFDRITSVGMFEHVGLKNLPAYFKIIHDLLTPEGWALNHGITSTGEWNSDDDSDNGGSRFINQYVFPDGELPHIGTVLTTMQEGGLEAIDVEGLRRHYARTLQCWSETFEAKTERVRQLVDDKHWRIWRVYLIGCQWAFEHDEVSLFQVLCHRAGQSAQGLPWSRRWMYGESVDALNKQA